MPVKSFWFSVLVIASSQFFFDITPQSCWLTQLRKDSAAMLSDMGWWHHTSSHFISITLPASVTLICLGRRWEDCQGDRDVEGYLQFLQLLRQLCEASVHIATLQYIPLHDPNINSEHRKIEAELYHLPYCKYEFGEPLIVGVGP